MESLCPTSPFPQRQIPALWRAPKKILIAAEPIALAPEGEIHTASETQSSSGEEESTGAEARGERGVRPPATTPHRKGTGRRFSPLRSAHMLLMSGEDSTTRSIVLIVMEGLSGAGLAK